MISVRLKHTVAMTLLCVAAAVALDFVLNGVFRLGNYTPWTTAFIALVVALPAWHYIVGQRQRLEDANTRLNQALHARDAAEAASAAKSTFLANMSHELRTPLNAIIGYSEIMLEDAEADNRKGDVADHRRILSAATHLLQLITGVLDFSKVEAGHVAVSPTRFDVQELAQEALAAVSVAARANDNALTVECGADVGIAFTDRTRLNQCLLNLLTNAAKFTRKGRVALRIKRERVGGVDWLLFAVADTGIGIDPTIVPRLFEAFEQADPSITREFGGTGLGLAITRRLARLMGGDVSVSSTLGRGSVFTLRIPAELAREAHLRLVA